MPNRKLVRRPEWDLHSGRDADASGDWRRFVLEQVGYDEVARDREARRTTRRMAVRRFVRGLAYGLLVFALAFGVMLVAPLWREGRFDRYLPHTGETMGDPPPYRRARAEPADVTERHDSHVIQQYPFARPQRATSPRSDPDDGSPAQAGPAPDGDGD